MSVNWKWPGLISVTPLKAIHSVAGSVGKVVANTLKSAPGVLVKANCTVPLGSLLALTILGDGGAAPHVAPGSYNSVLTEVKNSLSPPMARTWPLGNKAAERIGRAIFMRAAGLHVPLD